MKTSKRGLAEIAGHEGIVTSRYKDSAGVWTIGIGHTSGAGEPDPSKITRALSVAEIMEIFTRDIAKFEARVNKAFTKPLTQEQFDAAVSFDFNTGAIHKATWVKSFNRGMLAEARKGFMNWTKPKEITARRAKERDLFFSGEYSTGGVANVYPAVNGKVQWSQGKRVNVMAMIDSVASNASQKPADAKQVPGALPGVAATGGGLALLLWAKWDAFTAYLGSFF